MNAHRQSSIVNHNSQSGIALVLTVILLAVVTVMVLALLAVSRRERGAVTTTTDQTTARYAADAALANAEAQIMANVLAHTNPYDFGLVVSTNYINPYGFQPGVANPTNVNYDYRASGGVWSQNDFLQNLANLYYSPRVPVFIPNPTNPSARPDFRFYLDLNRNGAFDTNGVVEKVDNEGNPLGPLSETGDPEWIGGLERPDAPYGPDNRFLYRYAFVALPVGNTLDLNYIYNYAKRRPPMRSGNDSFYRNEGVGSWEINLAAFLADLNTDEWLPLEPPNNQYYNYSTSLFDPNRGKAFDDAFSLLYYRYGSSQNGFNNLASVDNLFGVPGADAFLYDNVDGYAGGPLMTGLQLPLDNDHPAWSWPGADNPIHFFDMQELFDRSKAAADRTPNLIANGADFTDHLLAAGADTFGGKVVSTYDRYTFYRLLSQLGTDSAPLQNRINLNWSNAVARFDPYTGVATNIAVFPDAQTNFAPWDPLQFFTITADRLLRAYSEEWLAENPTNYVATYRLATNIGTFVNPVYVPVPFGITNIPVVVNGQFVYSPAIQRVLQLAANICDATTNRAAVFGRDYPSVFKPLFLVQGTPAGVVTNILIVGYQAVTNFTRFPAYNDPQLFPPVDWHNLRAGFSAINYGPNGVNVFGVPWIIGAKKGFPNFNEFSMESVVGITRRLQVTRPATNTATVNLAAFRTNQMYIMTVTNFLGVECWNSYTNTYTNLGPLSIVVRDYLTAALNNDAGLHVPFNAAYNLVPARTIPATPPYWPSSFPWTGDGKPSPLSFDIPFITEATMPLNTGFANNPGWWTYVRGANDFVPVPNAPLFETGVNLADAFPRFTLLTTNWLQVFMLDGNHVIDYASFAGPVTIRDLNAEFFTDDNNGVWNTNLSTTGAPDGVVNQVMISRGAALTPNSLPPPEDGAWHADPEAVPLGGTVAQQQAYFDAFFKPYNIGAARNGTRATNVQLSVQAPYAPTRFVVDYTTWQANDPLVHDLASDLNYTGPTSGGLAPGTNTFNYTASNSIPILPNLGKLNEHYSPWGGSPYFSSSPADTSSQAALTRYNLAVKDPLVWRSDDWYFPANKLPTTGWLGRVHRGTPWQTVYLKSPDVLAEVAASGPLAGQNIGVSSWAQWTGDTRVTTNGQYFDAINSAPDQDRLLFDLFSAAPDDNATRGTLSVNVDANEMNTNEPATLAAGLAAWSALFSGVIVLSNTASDSLPQYVQYFPQHPGTLPAASFPIQPAGPAYTNSPLGRIVAGINAARANFVNVGGLKGAFEHTGDILAVPQLSVASPFLHVSNYVNNAWADDPYQKENGVSDEMYEWLPQQVMSLLRCPSSPRYVIYSFGQALKPAPNSIFTGGDTLADGRSAFGMVTNYQVVAEVDTRAVVQFDGTVTNVVSVTNDFSGFPHLFTMPVVTNSRAVIQKFNVLPPE
ncbi:MAG: hypothetical protein KGJ60_04670 [Verrucomicrobiota bacterium]|nr:hypothetical protein [Verrucomicrobiota bacterium]